MLLEGMFIPLTTPFHPDGRLNPLRLASNVARYSKMPAAGLIVLGPSGEPTLLSDHETRETLRTAALAAAPEKVLLAGISRDSVHATLALADFAAELDYDAVLVGVPSVLPPLRIAEAHSGMRLLELLTYFQIIADRSPLPVVLLSAVHRPLPVDTVVELAHHPQIIGLFEAATEPSRLRAILERTATIERKVTVTPVFAAVTARMIQAAATESTRPTLISAASLSTVSSPTSTTTTSATATAIAEPPLAPLRTRTRTVGFQVIAGATAGLFEALRAGAVGVAPAFAACAPQACYEVFAAWKDSDLPLAEEKQDRLNAAACLAEDGVGIGPGGLKFACDLNGYFGGLPRLPHLAPNGEHRAELEQLMKPLRN